VNKCDAPILNAEMWKKMKQPQATLIQALHRCETEVFLYSLDLP